MTHEQFITLETAELAKQAGFDWKCKYYYRSDEQLIYDHDGNVENWNDKIYSMNGYVYSAPTQSVLQRWLREVHNLIVVVKPYYGKEVVYGYIIYQEAEECIKRIEDGIVDRSYEYTLEAAEQKCLTILIKKQ